MRQIIFIFFCFFVMPLKATVLELTIDGKPNGEIVLQSKASKIVKFAASELQKTIFAISGAKLPITNDATSDKVKIYLGREFAETKFKDDIDFFKDLDGFAVRVDGDSIYIFGAIPEGTRNGVYEFLERNTDIIWARPQEFGTIFSKTPTIKLKNVNFREQPSTIWRGWQITSVGHRDKKSTHDWLIRNRCNWSDYGPKKSLGGGHNIKKILKKEMVDGHPFVGMTKGKRLRKGSPQVCFSNREMWKVFTKNFLKFIEDNPGEDRFEIHIDDTNRTCECAKCAKAFTLPNGKILEPSDPTFRSTQFYMFLNHVALAVKKRYPNIRINSYAYVFTIIPPKVELVDNISLEIAPLTRDYKSSLLDPPNKRQYSYIQKYSESCDDVIIYEYYGWSEFPRPISDIVSKELRYFNKRGIKRIHSEVNADLDIGPWNNKKYMLSQVWDAGAMEYWIISKLYWNPFLNVDKLREKYLKRAYRKASPAMKRYYDIIRKSWNSTKGKTNFRGYAVNLMARYVIEQGHEKKCRQALLDAGKKAEDPRVKEMVKRAYDLFEKYLKKAKATLPPEVNVPYIKGASKVSFDFNSRLWSKAGVISNFNLMGTTIECKDKTIVRLICDNINLYIGYDCQGKVESVVTNKQLDGVKNSREPWLWGNNIETFISDDKRSYYQLNADSKGDKYDSHGFNKSWNGEWTVQTKVTKYGWKAIMVIPFVTVGIEPTKKSRIKALFYRQSNRLKEKVECSWKGILVNRPSSFGIINIEISQENN